MLEKARYWNSAFPLAASLLCVSPREIFLDKWYALTEQNFAKVKDRTHRNVFVRNVARLVWVAVFRCPEQQNQFTRKMDLIFKMIFPVGKRLQHLIDLPQEPLIQMVRFVGAKNQDYCFKNMIFPLIGIEHLNNIDSALDLEVLYPERVTIAIRAFLYIVSDLEGDQIRPPFPIDFTAQHAKEGLIGTNISSKILNSPLLQDFHDKFSAYLCRVAFFCDQHFGGQAILDERMPMAPKITFSQLESSLSINGVVREKQQYYDLLAAIFDALPRCMSSRTPVPRVIEIICKATVHLDAGVRSSARKALKTIATTDKVQSSVVGYARVMLKFDAQNSQNTEGTLRLYIELLNIWVDRIQNKSKDGDATGQSIGIQGVQENVRGEEMEMINIWTVIEETEAHGLFFLCNQSRHIRKRAIEILRLVSRFDAVMDEQAEASKTSTHARKPSKASSADRSVNRIIDILLFEAPAMLESMAEQASVAERSRTNKMKVENSTETLIKIAESESGIDAAIWFKVFPRLIEFCFEKFPITVVLCRNLICNRLLKMQSSIINAIDNLRSPHPFDVMARANSKIATSPESTIEQWKLYLIMACSTLTLTDEQVPNQSNRHGRKRSIPVATFERITSARSLFQIVLPMLSVDHTTIREAIVISLGCININLYKVLLEDLQPMMRALAEATKQRMSVKSGVVRNTKKLDRLRTEITHILQLTSHFLAKEAILKDEWVLETVLSFLKDVKSFLSDDEVQVEWEYQRLRRFFCGLLEAVWEGLLASSDPSRWLPFEGRVSCFRLIEEWCNHGLYEAVAKEREDIMRQSIMDAYRDNRDRGALTASMEIEKRNVEFAALSAMASLCKGPVTQNAEPGRPKPATMSFEIDGVFAWIAAIFGNTSEKIHSIGRRALTNLLKYNLDFTVLYQEAVHQCYTHDFDSKSAQSYFTVLAEVLTEQETNPCGLSQLLALCLFKSGDRNVDIRVKTLALLRATEVRFYGRSCVESFAAAITNQNPVIYKRGQYLLAAQIARDHEEEKFLIFSECSKFFRLVETRLQRDVVAILLPWVQITELQLDINGEDLDAASHMVLVNLFEITMRFSDTLLNEIEGLWTALVTGRHIGNVKAILDFTISQSVARREPLFVSCGKQVIVYLSRSPAGTKIMEALLAYLHPRAMIPQVKEPLRLAMEDQDFAYVADLDRVFHGQQKHVVFSLGQLALIFMVDLMVTPSAEIVPQAPMLLLVVFALLDHYIPLVQNQARELYVYLTHNLCLEHITDDAGKHLFHDYLGRIRRKDSKLSWTYDQMDQGTSNSTRTLPAMEAMVTSTLDLYSGHLPKLKEEWGKLALTWATSCPVRHMACRSFQVFRCLSSTIDQDMLSDMLARLSNTIADSSHEIQAFAMEILCTLNVIVANMAPADLANYPQLFWCTIACLDTIHEAEFVEALSILEKLLDKVDLAVHDNVVFFVSNMPPKWDGAYEGITKSLLKGMRSNACMVRTLRLINRVIAIPSNELVGSDSRLLFAILANLPSFVHALSINSLSAEVVTAANTLARMAESQALSSLSRIFDSFAKARFRSTEDFTRQVSSLIRQSYFPQWEAQTLVFLLGLLSNKQPWVKVCTMELLKAILPFVDTRRAEFAGVGADLISPLLRLLQTEYAQAGLEVLDKAIAISQGPKDRQVLRMSLGNRTIRKEYEKTATLFGIPEESGWAVPMPASAASKTRANVHAVFYTCAVTLQSQEMPDHVQFHMEDYAYHPPSDRSETMLSVEGGESSLGDMVSALHNLDVFFTEDVDLATTPTTAEYASEQAPASVYDSRVAAILSRSLARTPSISSFTSPGFDTSPSRGSKSPILDRHPASPLISNGFSFPRQARPPVVSARNATSPAISYGSDSAGENDPEHDTATVLDDDKSEISFKLDGQLKKSGSSMRSKLWSTKDPDRMREKESKRKDRVHLKLQPKGRSADFGPTSPSGRAYFWSSTIPKDKI